MTNLERAEKIYRLLLKPETSLEYADPTDFIVAQLEEVQREVIQDRDAWKSRAEALAKALELLCGNVAGTEGTKTNSELPAFYRARLKDAQAVLITYEEDLKR